jgi:protein-L-isoaspartate(D-aspartate) O-methyltransferase
VTKESSEANSRDQERQRLLATIVDEVRETRSYTGRAELNPRVLDAMGRVAREAFVPEDQMYAAYANVPLPIGHRQTISQPYIVALMTDLLDPESSDVILEIGTGSGYQAAVLSGLVARVYSIEVVEALADTAAERLARLGYANVEFRHGDGNEGWPEAAPFDGIIVTAGAPSVPDALIEQLKPGAALVIPVDDGFRQMLRRITRDEAGTVTTEDVLPVAFVPLIETR